MNPAPFEFSFDTVAAFVALAVGISNFAVSRQKIADLERRVEILEKSERNHSDRVTVIETKLENIVTLLERIAEKLDVS